MTNAYGLSKREEEVTRLLLEGKSNKQIALALNISDRTVEFHLTKIYARLGVGSRTELIIQLSRLESHQMDAEEDKARENPSEIIAKLGESPVVYREKSANNEVILSEPTQEIDRQAGKNTMTIGKTKTLIPLGILFVLLLILMAYLLMQALKVIAQMTQVTMSIPTARPAEWSANITLGGASLPIPRARHTATRLPDGRVLLIGGQRAPNISTAEVAFFDPQAGSATQANPLHTARHDHTATLLLDGRVLVVGGSSSPGKWLDDAEVFDPATNTWMIAPPLYSHGTSHTATLMKDGRVLVAGGCTGSGVCTERVEIFDPHTNTWIEAATLPSDRASQTAQLLEDGRVLLAGGENAQSIPAGGDALIYDPRTNQWTATGPMVTQRVMAESVRLASGKVLVAGGAATDGTQIPQILASAEIYDPATNTWGAAASLAEGRYAYKLVLLPDGQVLAVGGARHWDSIWSEESFVSKIELYDPVTGHWHIAGELPRPGACAAGVLLTDGALWITGGVRGASGSTFKSDTWRITLQPIRP